MVCNPLFHNGAIGTVPCIVFSLDLLLQEFPRHYSNNEKVVIVDDVLLMYYPVMNKTQDYCKYAFDITCIPNGKSEAKLSQKLEKYSFNYNFQNFYPEEFLLDNITEKKGIDSNKSKIMSFLHIYNVLHDHNNSTQIELDDKEIISISPININLPILQGSYSNISIILNTTKSAISRKFDKLSKNLTITIIVQVTIFSVVLVAMIFFVCVISIRITGAILSPIDDLFKILQRLHTDLGVDVKLHQKKGPPEIINLYEVFDKLRLILRFEDLQLFQDPAYAMMNYAQALQLFNDFNNKAAMEVCFEEIGHIHMSHGRYKEAAINYYSSYNFSEELGLIPQKIAAKKINTAKALMAANVKQQKAKELFIEAINFYEAYDIKLAIKTYLECAESFLFASENADPEIMHLEELIHRFPEHDEGYLFLQRFVFLKGIQAYNYKHYREAAEYLTDSIENFPIIDIKTRKNALKYLRKIFKQFKLPLTQIKDMENSFKDSQKDVVLVVDSKIGSALNDDLLITFTGHIINHSDRLSFIQFDESCQILFNLTKFPKIRCSTVSSLFDLRNICVLNDAIYSALTQLISVKSLAPKSFLSNEVLYKE